MIVAGLFSQWYKAHHADNELARSVSRSFERSFFTCSAFALALVVLEWFVPFHNFLGIREVKPGPTGKLTTEVLTAFPPLLAATGLSVFYGILAYRMWGVSAIQHRPRALSRISLALMALYLGSEYVVHGLVEQFGHAVGLALALTLLVGVMGGFLLERPRERLTVFFRRLIFGTPSDPTAFFADFIRELATSLSPESVVAALSNTLLEAVGVNAGRLRVAMADGQNASYVWPPGTTVSGESIPLLQSGFDLGEASVVSPPERTLSDAERQLVSQLASQAALVIRAMSTPNIAGAHIQTGGQPDGRTGL